MMEEKLYKNRDWMYHHYIEMEELTYAMAREAGCCHATIQNWLNIFNIRRSRSIYEDHDWLYEHYVVLQESTYVIARMVGCNGVTILRWLRKFNIPTRSAGEATFLAQRNFLDLSNELSDLLEGELLGDGCAKMSSSRSAIYSHSSKYREYLEWLSGEFADLGLEQVGKINRYDGISKGKPYTIYCYVSRSYPELVPIRQKWYPNGKKIVPKDLKLNPLICRQWYIGDGHLHNRARGRSDINFSTDDFDKASIDYLLTELGDRGFKVTHQPANNKIGMSVESVRDFLEWIGPCPIDCYSHKWDYRDNRRDAH